MGKSGNSDRFYLSGVGSKITMDDDFSHEIKRHLLQHLYFKLNLQENSFTELFAMQHEDFTKEDLMESKAQRKDKERQEEEVTEESHSAANGKGIFFIWGAVFVFVAQELNIEQYTKVAAAIWNAIQSYHVIYDKKKTKQ